MGTPLTCARILGSVPPERPPEIGFLEVGPVRTLFCEDCDFFAEIYDPKCKANGYHLYTGKACFDGLSLQVTRDDVVSAIKAYKPEETIRCGAADITYRHLPENRTKLTLENHEFYFQHPCKPDLKSRSEILMSETLKVLNKTKNPVTTWVYNKNDQLVNRYTMEFND